MAELKSRLVQKAANPIRAGLVLWTLYARLEDANRAIQRDALGGFDERHGGRGGGIFCSGPLTNTNVCQIISSFPNGSRFIISSSYYLAV
jgi:hypothetical protein